MQYDEHRDYAIIFLHISKIFWYHLWFFKHFINENIVSNIRFKKFPGLAVW